MRVETFRRSQFSLCSSMFLLQCRRRSSRRWCRRKPQKTERRSSWSWPLQCSVQDGGTQASALSQIRAWQGLEDGSFASASLCLTAGETKKRHQGIKCCAPDPDAVPEKGAGPWLEAARPKIPSFLWFHHSKGNGSSIRARWHPWDGTRHDPAI